MRLIDGDALKANVLKRLPSDQCGRLLQEIDEAPTIDAAPIRRGEWADVHFRTVPYDRITGAKKCPYCGKKKDKYVQWNWCPNCGAKLMNNKVSTKIGEWVDDGDPLTLVCGVCGYRVMRYNNTKFCPNCGTRTDGDGNEAD